MANRQTIFETNPRLKKGYKYWSIGTALLLIFAVAVSFSSNLSLNFAALILLGTWLVLSVVFGLGYVIGIVAEEKGRNFGTFFALTILFSPLIIGTIVAVMSPLPGSKRYIAPEVRTVNSNQAESGDKILKLAELRDKGLITEEEFLAKKKDLLDSF